MKAQHARGRYMYQNVWCTS